MIHATHSSVAPPPAHAIEGLYATGHWLFTQGRLAHALSVFQGMIHLVPEDERAWLATGFCYEAQDLPDFALDMYDAGMRFARHAPRCAVARARILRKRGLLHEARLALAHAARAAQGARDEELRALIAAEWTR
jgi:Flp pilus assembly protein TadD